MDANSVNKPLCQCGWGQLGESVRRQDPKATGRNEFTCDAVLPRLHQAGKLDCSTQTGSVSEQRLTRSADNLTHSLSHCAGTCLSSCVSFHLPLSSTLGYERGISAVPRDRRRRFRGTRRHKLEVVKDLHQFKNLSQG